MKIKYIGPFDAVEVDIFGRTVTVAHGDEIEVVAAIAGRPPSDRLAELMADLEQHYTDHVRRSEIVAELATVDAGEGLLAQSSNWVAVTAKKEPKS